jgi:hypothetical protein
MRASLLILLGIVVGCAAGAVVQSPLGTGRATAAAGVVEQYCTDTGQYNDVAAVDQLVRKAGQAGWQLIGVYRANPLGMARTDYVCFYRPR